MHRALCVRECGSAEAHVEVVHGLDEPLEVAVEDVVRRAGRLQVEVALVAEAVVQPVQECPVRGRALHAPRGQDGEQPLERRRRHELVVSGPAVATNEDADVADKVGLEQDERPARRRRERTAQVQAHSEQQDERHHIVMVDGNRRCRRHVPRLHRRAAGRAHPERGTAVAGAAVVHARVTHQTLPAPSRAGDARVRERRVPRWPAPGPPDAVRIAELLAVGLPIAVAVLAADGFAPGEAGGRKVVAKRVPLKQHVREVHFLARTADCLRQR